MSGLWMMGTILLGVQNPEWQEILYVEGEVASQIQCSMKYEKGWHAQRRSSFEELTGYWPQVSKAQQWGEIGLQAVHRDGEGRLLQLDTKHFQHRFRYREDKLVSIHTRDDWEEHEYIVVWKNGLPTRLVGYLEHIEMVYDDAGVMNRIIETWLDEPEIQREILLRGPWTDPRLPLPFSMGWLFSTTGRLNPEWLEAWWLSKQRFSDAVARLH